MASSGIGRIEWNIVASTRHGMMGKALSDLAPFGWFRHTPYPGVLIGVLPGGDPLSALAEASRSEPGRFQHVNRATPIEKTAHFERDDIAEQVCLMVADDAARLAGKSFYVRARLRGLKGKVESQAVERAIGSFLWEQSARFGERAEIEFDAPDAVVAIEVVGKRVGVSVLERDALDLEIIRPR